MYKNVFFDLDNTLWAFTANARKAFIEVYQSFSLSRYFLCFNDFMTLFEKKNIELWEQYNDGKITKDELNRKRFLYPLEAVGCPDEKLSEAYSTEWFRIITLQKELMPYAREVLDYLHSRYHLYILSNGFSELQLPKMKNSGIDHYFERIILSEEAGFNKPHKPFYDYAFHLTGCLKEESLIVGDDLHTDILGAQKYGVDQVFYHSGIEFFPQPPTYTITSLLELKRIL